MHSFFQPLLLATTASAAVLPPLIRDWHVLTDFAATITNDPIGLVANWTAAGEDVCSFMGVTCAETPDNYTAVAGLDFNGFGLGELGELEIAGLLDGLKDLTFFHANSNNFSGAVPDVSDLKYLYELDLSNNLFSEPFPEHVLRAPLTFLDLRFNNFTGPLPASLFTETDMDVIFLNDNNFSGELPEFGAISTLYLTLANNKFTGSIPASIANAANLTEVLLLGNQFEGTLPEELCALNLTVLDVSDNAGLSGKLGPKCAALRETGVLQFNGTSLEL